MRIIIFSFILLSVYISPVPGYEVVFYEGFEEGEWPEGWDGSRCYITSPGFDSAYCIEARAIDYESGGFSSPWVPINPDEFYTVTYYAYHYDWAEYESYLLFDNDTTIDTGGFGLSHWVRERCSFQCPQAVNYVKFVGYCYTFFGYGTSIFMDDLTFYHTYSSLKPTSLGRVKAAYR